jgi:hypothetical protein
LIREPYRNALPINFSWLGDNRVGHSWMYGLILFGSGYAAAKTKNFTNKIATRNIVKLCLTVGALFAFERLMLIRAGTDCGDSFLYITMPPLIFLVMNLLIRFPNLGRGTFWPRLGARYTLYIYILHAVIRNLIYSLENHFGVNWNGNPRFLLALWIVCFAVSLGLGAAYWHAKQKILASNNRLIHTIAH